MMLFNSGKSPNNLPIFKLQNDIIQYTQSVKFLGVYFSSKLSWNQHIEYILTKARNSFNLMKVICKQTWGQDPSVLIHLVNSLIRSKLTYAQEIIF
jgi:hypothetical protein